MADEVGHEAGGRAVVEGVGVIPLVQVAFVHHADHVANGKGLELVVRHEQGGGPCGFQNAAHLVRQPFAQVYVQVGKGLVQQHELRARRQGTGQGHALLLAAREFVGVAVLAAFQAHQLQHFGHAGSLFGARQLVNAKRHIAPHRQVREQRVVLKHHANAALLGRHAQRGAAHHAFGQADFTAGNRLQPRYGTQQSGLAAARRANEHADVARMQAQRNTMNGGLCAAGVAHIELGDL